MKNIGKYLLYICNIVLVCLITFNIISYDLKSDIVTVFALGIEEDRYISYLEKNNIKEEVNITDIQKEEKVEIKEETIIDVPLIGEQDVKENEFLEDPKEEITDKVVLETLIGNLVGYGPDCYGCTSNKTASGKYIGEGDIYYEDDTYGKVRIVAGDYSYPFGTIVRISNVDFYNDEPFYAIVLDRGGDIGKNKKFMFDLLFNSEKEALPLGKEVNVKFEIMRLGY